ncbi:ATP-binding cassette subfamily B protein [Keratinibaculum paraultunense]|uniref:ATP-binding cassette subfamily B protein n=1 Tax=Keratinibaculum paraultunense TaxID=1278232 RepID=A0A4R3KXB4_9FIRM|nr:ABC transporter ATP-binding protein [Keratinibaculum paraultunense]QQY78866.1 ABC transporter ATP-binding protein [Keratinibaculum paraultunense]TCS90477.1 ATP-binding cassette subfamily B protein [Keratinibaculum paraultunense]
MNLAYLKKYIQRYKVQFITALIFLILEAVVDLIQPTIMSKIVDVGVKNRDINYVFKLGGLMLFITFLGAIFAVTRNIKSSKVSQNFGADLREDLYIKIQRLSLEDINEIQDATLITRLTNDVNQMQNFAHGLMRVFVKAPILGIGSVIMAFILDFKMGLILLGIIPIVGIVVFINLKVSYPIFVNIQKAIDKVNGVIREYLSGIRVVKAFNRFKYEEARFKKVNEELKDVTTEGIRKLALFSPIVSLIVNIGIVLILWIGGIRVNAGNLEVGKIIALINYMTQLLFSLVMVIRIFNMYVRAKASAERIGEIFSIENPIVVKENPISLDKVEGNLEFANVYFKYHENSRYVLEDINFSINSGEFLAIIGSTGSGKSTLINLIPRLYDPSKGVIKIDGIDIKDLEIRELRESIAIVPQNILLFTGTIKENIKWGKEDATEEEIIKAAKIAQAHDFIISFNEGYDTYLGQGGVNLSGGQKQRIAIARALVRKAKFLILDDSTSAVDMITEKKIKKGLKEHLEDTTVIMIAQRITSVMDADKILVMDKGKIVNIGKHNELLNSSKIYSDIYRSQIGEEGLNIGS